MASLMALIKMVPAWCWLPVFGLAIYLFGDVHGAGRVQRQWEAETEARNEQTRELNRARQLIVTKTEIVYRDRIKTIYVKGEEIEKQVQEFVTADDDQRYGVNAGFVRLYDAAWAGEIAGPAAESDRGPAGVSLSQISAVGVHNATSCLAWREIALGLRDYYQQQQAATGTPAQ